LIDYFKEYSLETPTIFTKDVQQFGRRDLLTSLFKQDEMNDIIKKKILIGKEKDVDYLNSGASESSS